eukprot:9848-Rhodomonas_salina.3
MPGTELACMLLPGGSLAALIHGYYAPVSPYARAMRCLVLIGCRPTRVLCNVRNRLGTDVGSIAYSPTALLRHVRFELRHVRYELSVCCYARFGALDVEAAAWFTSNIVSALMYLHQHGISHNDLKTANCFLQVAFAMHLRARYAMPGTDAAYRALVSD